MEKLDLQQRLEQAEAERDTLQQQVNELAKQKPVGTVSIAMDWNTHRYVATVNMRPDLVVSEMKDGDELFTRPAPAADLANLVPGASNMIPVSEYNTGQRDGWNACRAAILRNIEEAEEKGHE